MKTVLWSMLCLFLSGWGSMQAVLAQDLKEMEKNLSAINEELSQKTKEYSWQLAAAYADYCEANNKYISWNDLPYLQQVVEYERPASLETYRLEHKASKEELDKFLNTYKEYKDLVKKQKEAVTKEEKDAVSTAFSAFWKKLRSEENAYKDLYYAERKAVCSYGTESDRYTLFNSGNLRYFICACVLYDRCLGRTSSKEIKVLAYHFLSSRVAGRHGGYKPDGAYCRTDSSA